MSDWLDQATAAGTLRPLDAHFARFVEALAGAETPALTLAAALASQQLGEGHVCTDLADHAGQRLFADRAGAFAGVAAPALSDWLAALSGCPAVAAPGETAPLVLDGHRLYLHRYWGYEQRLARRLRAMAATATAVDEALLADGLNRLFGPPGESIDWQRIAAAAAVLQRFAVISGGPGTGKTHTVSRVLALLAEQYLAAGHRPRIRLAAPTGKAAARLTESITANLPEAPAQVLETIPRQAQTLHRLLGARPGQVQFRHDADNPLHLDVLLVDEASMVDLPLMARLVAALPEGARLILLGDRDQLASVEAGAVLGEICAGAEGFSPAMAERLGQVTGQQLPPASGPPPLADGITVLQHSYRFSDGTGDAPGIGALARAVRAGDRTAVERILATARDGGEDSPVAFQPLAEVALADWLAERALPFYRGLAGCTDPGDALARLGELRILCALRDGPFGVGALNTIIRAGIPGAGHGRWYHGQPLMITANDYRHGLFNGDTGIVLRHEGTLRAFFPAAAGGPRHFAPQRLPAHETVYAMTVHKSQGSEFDQVLMVLPDQPSPVLTRELLYTGITRARRRVELAGHAAIIAAAAEQPVRRVSGLGRALAGDG